MVRKLIISRMSVSLSKSEIIQVRRINNFIKNLDNKYRKIFPILQHQNLIGLSIFLFAVLGSVFNSYLYYLGYLNGCICFFLNAFLFSLLHELEHDLIHHLYFNKNKLIQNMLFVGIWIFRPNLISPWARKKLHLRHHQESGQAEDIEERLIGNGLPWGWKRILVSLNSFWAVLLINDIKKQSPHITHASLLSSAFPMMVVFNAFWWGFLVNSGYYLFTHSHLISTDVSYVLNFAAVVIIGPNLLRQFCLSVISSNCHYYGDIAKGQVLKQGQVLQPWYLVPLQLFCFNFGSTHIIHHFVVEQPFYLRQIVAPLAHKFMKKHGIRFNDIETIFHANRYQLG